MRVENLSISVRLRRLTTEAARVSVPIADELMVPDETGSGSRKLNVDKVMDAALAMAQLESRAWEFEGEAEIQLHPLQTPPGQKSIQ